MGEVSRCLWYFKGQSERLNVLRRETDAWLKLLVPDKWGSGIDSGCYTGAGSEKQYVIVSIMLMSSDEGRHSVFHLRLMRI